MAPVKGHFIYPGRGEKINKNKTKTPKPNKFMHLYVQICLFVSDILQVSTAVDKLIFCVLQEILG